MLSEGTDYDFEDFDCGEPSLNAFLAEHLVRQHNGRLLRAYLLKERDRLRDLGYSTLSGSCFERAMLPSKT
ncbi:N-acetyltransferase, partial [Raoultella ornithinolytica]